MKTNPEFGGFQLPNYPITKLQNLLHFLVRRVLAAPVAELLFFDAVRRRFAILRGRVIPLFALTTLQRNDLSGHCSLQTLLRVARTLLSALHAVSGQSARTRVSALHKTRLAACRQFFLPGEPGGVRE